MKILAIDTSTPVGSIALAEGALLKAQHILNVGTTHNQRLLPGIDRLLGDTGWTVNDLDALAVSLGPGSFTGLRIGMSTIKGLAWATGKPLAGIPTLDALAANIPAVPYQICPVLDARKGEIYTALYRQGDEQVPVKSTPYMTLKPEELTDLIVEKTVFVGDGLLRYGNHLSNQLGDRLLQAPPHLNIVHASCVAWMAWQMLQLGQQEAMSGCIPLCVRP